MIRVGILDDHNLILESLRGIIDSCEDMDLVLSSTQPSVFLENTAAKHPDVVIIDFQMEGMNGLEVVEHILKNFDQVKVILLSGNVSEYVFKQAVEKGAKGILAKDASKSEITEAIRRVHAGENHVGSTLYMMAQSVYMNREAPLSKREVEIIQWICKGKSYKEIGEALFISDRTVENHRNNILQKLELQNNIELVRYALKNHLVQ